MLENGGSGVGSTSGPPPTGTVARQEPHNRLGRNQYKDRPSRDDPYVAERLKAYHLKGINDKTQISKLLLEEDGITLSPSSIARRKKELGLRASRLTTRELGDDKKRQLILDQMAKDPAGKYGPRMVKQRIFEDTGIHLTRDYIRSEMKILDPVGSSTRGPAHVKARRQRRLEEGHDGRNDAMDHEFVFDRRMESVPASSGDISDEDDVDMPEEISPPPPEDDYPSSIPIINQAMPPEPAHFTSPALLPVLHTLHNLIPQMRSLIRGMDSIEGVHLLTRQDHASLLDGMESSALLERALSRLVSKSRPF